MEGRALRRSVHRPLSLFVSLTDAAHIARRRPLLGEGETVEVVETSRVDLNGQTGTTLRFDHAKGRYQVKFVDETSAMLRPRNVRKIETEVDVDRSAEQSSTTPPRPLAMLQGIHPAIAIIAEMLGVRYKDLGPLRRTLDGLTAL